MGTRHLIEVIVNGETKVAQYGQWDGYPEGQGEGVCSFIETLSDLEAFKKAVEKLRFLTGQEIKDRWTECGADPESSFVNMEVATKHDDRWPWLSRDCGSNILKMIAEGLVDGLDDASSFKDDGLFCEFRYVLDLDNETLGCYIKGTQKFADFSFSQIKEKGTANIVAEMNKILESDDDE